jgi:hypothetical protein
LDAREVKHSTNSPTLYEQNRFKQLQDVGCVVCRLHFEPRPADVSHLLSGGRRISHSATIPECEWHHRAVPVSGWTEAQCFEILGPTRAKHPAEYRFRFGTDQWLLNTTNTFIAHIEACRDVGTVRKFDKKVEVMQPREWTVVGDHAIKTRQMSIAIKVSDQIEKLADGAKGPIDGVEWMTLAEFEQRTSK